MCWLARVSRAGYYRAWAADEPDAEEMDLRDRIQRIAVEHRHYGYRRVTAELRRQGRAVNHKRVARLMRLDNLLALRRTAFRPPTTDSKHTLRVYLNLAARLQLTGPNQFMDRRSDLYSSARRVRLSRGGAGPVVAQGDRVAVEPFVAIDAGGSGA
jgi:transposase InsO family protein